MVGFSQKGKFARSVAAVAAELGLPRLLVDVRHEATHNDLPGLPLLRVAAELATAWLREHYWAAQRRHLRACGRRLRAAVARFVALQAAAAAARGPPADQPRPPAPRCH